MRLITRALLAYRLWRDRHLAFTLRRAWRAAGRMAT